jgi:SNF2 family DNA or RNA helicase
VAKALAQAAPTAIQGLTWLRELSDGFQYREVQEGVKECPSCRGAGECEVWKVDDNVVDVSYELLEGESLVVGLDTCPVCGGETTIPNMVRETKILPTPKDDALKDLLEENDEQGRIVIFAGFQGSIDRVTKLCLDMKWNVCQVDGRGWKVLLPDGQRGDRQEKVLDHWANMDNRRVAFVAHPQSGGLGLTLTEACMAVFYSNDYSPESRTQAMARIHRIGTDINKGATIVDLFHLPTDEKVLNVLKDNRRLERMTLEEFREMI